MTDAARAISSSTRAVARDAGVGDLDAVVRLLSWWSRVGLTIPRERSDLEASIGQFSVAERGGGVVACGALEPSPGGVSEIRSVSVDPEAKGTGAGRAVVESLIERARRDGARRLVLLTRTPEFFVRCGFAPVPVKALCPVFMEFAVRQAGRTTHGRVCMEFPAERLGQPSGERVPPARGQVVVRPIR